MYVALLRGINVSGSKIIKMEDLRACMAKSGFRNISTYIQSGNILFESENMTDVELETRIGSAILNDFGFQVPVEIISKAKLKQILQENPFLKDINTSIDSLHLTILSAAPSPDLFNKLMPLEDDMDSCIFIDECIYLKCPNGYGRTKFTNTFFEKKLKLNATTRNWKTMAKLGELIAS
ncbi:MAG: DUF1697 domain-containing protein [Bacteroidetes bacterium]|nr:DUF1697 domain-containing protein [Bacteroidota bacterium]